MLKERRTCFTQWMIVVLRCQWRPDSKIIKYMRPFAIPFEPHRTIESTTTLSSMLVRDHFFPPTLTSRQIPSVLVCLLPSVRSTDLECLWPGDVWSSQVPQASIMNHRVSLWFQSTLLTCQCRSFDLTYVMPVD